MLDIFLKKFWKYRKAIGLSFFFFGNPIIYFLRDGIKLAPGNSTFTAVFTLLPLVLILPKNMFKTLYMPNLTAYWLCNIFLGGSFIYLIFDCPNAGWFTNQTRSAIDMGIIISLFFLLTTVSVNELKDTFVVVTFFITVIGCLCVIYYIARNPLALIAMSGRIGILLGDGDSSTTNSHIFGKAGFAATMAGIILLKKQRAGLYKLFIIGGTIIGFVIMIMAQSMSTILAFGAAITFYAFYHISVASFILKSYQMIWNWRFLLTVFLVINGSLIAWERSSFFNSVIGDGYERTSSRLKAITNSVLTGKVKGGARVDLSASERVEQWKIVKKTLDENIEKGNYKELILGNGYEKLYCDSPMIQSFNDFGLIGFILYSAMFYVLIRSMLLTLRDTKNEFTNFICYIFCLILVQNFTAGMVIDYPKWCYFALIARYAISYKYYSKPSPMSLSRATTV